eukprot:scaffold105900_cov23-Tisochrysis_lutea.AAC.1
MLKTADPCKPHNILYPTLRTMPGKVAQSSFFHITKKYLELEQGRKVWRMLSVGNVQAVESCQVLHCAQTAKRREELRSLCAGDTVPARFCIVRRWP